MPRIPPTFFTPERAARIVALLRHLTPPARDVLMCHLDAPAWAIVDISAPPGSPHSSASTLGKYGFGERPLVVDKPPGLSDPAIGLTGSVYGEIVFWEWSPDTRATAYGTLAGVKEWETLRDRIRTIRADIQELLRYDDERAKQ